MKKRFIIGYGLLTAGGIELLAIVFLIFAYSDFLQSSMVNSIIIIFRCVIEILVGLHLIRKAKSLKQLSKANEET